MDYVNQLIESIFPPRLPAQSPQVPHRPLSSCSSSTPALDALMFSRLAGLSGALAVGFGAYGSHVLRESSVDARRKAAFDTGNRYHLIHSVALLASSHSRHPKITAALFFSAMALFSGSCYHYGFTGSERFRTVTPYGGILFIVAWLSFLL